MNNTILKATSILRLLASHSSGMTLTELSNALSIPKSSVFDIVHTLEHVGYLEVSNDRLHTYRLGLEAFRIGYSYLDGTSLDSVARPQLTDLCHRSGETVFMALRSGKSNFVYVMKFLSGSDLQTVFSVGAVRHLLSAALGKAILAALPNDQVLDAVTEDMYRTCSIPSIHDSTSLLAFLDNARKKGYVTDETSENSHMAIPVAAPILDVDNHVLGAISIVAMSLHISEDRLQALGHMVSEAALKISHNLGYMENNLYIHAEKNSQVI